MGPLNADFGPWIWQKRMSFQCSVPGIPAWGLVSKPHLFKAVRQAPQMKRLSEIFFYILVYAPRQQNFFVPWNFQITTFDSRFTL